MTPEEQTEMECVRMSLEEYLLQNGKGKMLSLEQAKAITVRWLRNYAPAWLARYWGVR